MCVKTLSAWKLGKKPNGKDHITFTAPACGKGEYLQLPCGQCIDCRLERSRVWAMRCMHEASLFDSNCFITLTFDDDHLDSIGSLRKRDFQLFMKRLRKHLSGAGASSRSVRFFHAGEYGDQFGRPHHHAVLFGFDFPDKILKVVRRGFRYYESPLLSKLWSFGFHEISDCSFETCAYVARYVCKKVNGEAADDHYSVSDEQGNIYKREPEYSTMSRRPGIGLNWYEKYKDTDVWAHDKVHIRGNTYCTPPRYYGSKFELTNPIEYGIIKEKRAKKVKDNPDNAFDRQRVREVVKTAQYGMLKRTLK